MRLPQTDVLCVREMKLAGWRSILQPAVRSILRREIDQEARAGEQVSLVEHRQIGSNADHGEMKPQSEIAA